MLFLPDQPFITHMQVCASHVRYSKEMLNLTRQMMRNLNEIGKGLCNFCRRSHSTRHLITNFLFLVLLTSGTSFQGLILRLGMFDKSSIIDTDGQNFHEISTTQMFYKKTTNHLECRVKVVVKGCLKQLLQSQEAPQVFWLIRNSDVKICRGKRTKESSTLTENRYRYRIS